MASSSVQRKLMQFLLLVISTMMEKLMSMNLLLSCVPQHPLWLPGLPRISNLWMMSRMPSRRWTGMVMAVSPKQNCLPVGLMINKLMLCLHWGMQTMMVLLILKSLSLACAHLHLLLLVNSVSYSMAKKVLLQPSRKLMLMVMVF